MTRGFFARLHRYRNDSLAVQSAVLIGARWIGFVLAFSIPIVLVRVFSRAEFGIYKQIFLIALTAVPILNLGLTASLFYFVPRDRHDGQRYVVQALTVLTCLGLLAGVSLALAAEPISRMMGGPELERLLRILAILITITIPSDLFIVSLPVVDRRPALAGVATAASDLIRAAGIILAALIFRSVEAVLWVAIGVASIRAAWLIIYVRIRSQRVDDGFNVKDLRRQLGYSLPFAAAVLFEIALLRFHEYYVASQVAPADFATYSIGVFQVPLLAIIVQSVVEVMLVRTASSARISDQVDMRQVWRQVVSFLALVLIPSWVAAQVWADDLILSLFGAAYLPSVPIFRVFLTIIPLMCLVDHGVLRATGDTRYLLKANIIGFTTSVVTILGLARFGVFMSAVTGLVVGVAAMRGVGLIKVASRLGLTRRTLLPWNLFVRVLAASAVSALIAVPTFGLAAGPGRLVVGGLVYVLVMMAMVWSGWLIEREQLQVVIRRIWGSAVIRDSDPAVRTVDLVPEDDQGAAAPASGPAASDDSLMILVSIDTEEDNWGRARQGVTCENIKALPVHVEMLRSLGLRPTFFSTHQVAVLPWAAEILRELDHDGAEVGSQLHPWNTPPESEPFVARLSMTKNLPPELQAAKIRRVTESVGEALGRQPEVFRTGRWGFGQHAAAALIDNGYCVDSSVLPFMSWEDVDEGPSFIGAPLGPYRLDGTGDIRVPVAGGPLIEMPASSGFNRTPFELWSGVYRQLGRLPLRLVRAQSIAVRSGLVRRILVSPETTSLADMLRVSDCLIASGLPYIQVYWHSPTIVPGLTPFAASRAEVDALFGKLDRYLDSLSKRFSLRFATLSEAARILDP